MADLAADVHRHEVVLWGGPGFHIVHYPLRHGTLFNIVGPDIASARVAHSYFVVSDDDGTIGKTTPKITKTY